MKIVSMFIENVIKIKAAFIQPSDNMVVIQGGNQAGKSSILDSIVMAFKGDRSLPVMPIKQGAKKGEIVINIDGNDTIPPFTITRTLTPKNAYIKIEPVEVLKGETPRSFLDKIIGSISFDPLEFINQEGKKQRKVLMELCGINVDELDKKEKEAFDERTIKGRELKAAENKVKGLKVWPDVKETAEIKVADLSKKLTEAITFNQSITNRQNTNEQLKQSGKKDLERIAKLEEDIAVLRDIIKVKKEQYNKEKSELDEMNMIDIEAMNEELQSIESKNAKIRDNIVYAKENQSLALAKTDYNNIDAKLETLRSERIQMIQNAAIPVPGLTFDEDGLLYNSIPLSQCSDGAKLMIGTAISMALNPTMRVLRIKDGSLLDTKNLKLLEEIVKEKDFQIFVEKVADKDQYNATGKVGIFIEEGEIQMIDGVEVEEKITAPKSTPVNRKTEPINQVQQDEEDW